jgi:hypothetical protein
MKTQKIIAITLFIASLIFIGCAKNAEVSQTDEMQKAIEQNMTDTLQISTSENPDVTAVVTAPSANTKDMVVGVWRAEHPMQGVPYMCISEWIYQNNGAYSGATQCGPYAMQRTGSWSLPDDNTIRVSLRDGNLVRWDSWKFKMLDRNRMALGDGRLIAYRVN